MKSFLLAVGLTLLGVTTALYAQRPQGAAPPAAATPSIAPTILSNQTPVITTAVGPNGPVTVAGQGVLGYQPYNLTYPTGVYPAGQSGPTVFYAPAMQSAIAIFEDPTTGALVQKNGELTEDESKLARAFRTKLSNAKKTLSSSTASASEKVAARDTIAALLRVQFDSDLSDRKDKIVELEAQIKQLREQLDRRQDSKEKLVQLRLQLIENESDGLGFPSNWGETTAGNDWHDARFPIYGNASRVAAPAVAPVFVAPTATSLPAIVPPGQRP
jgi:hypothetical protein